MKGMEVREFLVVVKGVIFLFRRFFRLLVSGFADLFLNLRFICFVGGSWILRFVGGFCFRIILSFRRFSVGGFRVRVLGFGRIILGGSEVFGGNGVGDWIKLKVGSFLKGEFRKESACRSLVRRWNDGL